MTDVNIAWAAGLFEGEGSITLKTRHGKPWPYLSLTMTDEDVVRRFVDIVGYGNISFRAKRKQHWKDQYEWSVGKKTEVRRILLMLLPLLGERRAAKAQRALENC